VLRVLAVTAAAASLLAAPSAGAACGSFGSPERVAIKGYDGVAMEPFVTPDGRYLLFNDSNDPFADTNLLYAERTPEGFVFRGELRGANSPQLDGVPSVDEQNDLIFISGRSYGQTFSTIYRAQFSGGTVSDVHLLDGVSRRMPGFANFDAGISPDGRTLVYVDAMLIPFSPLPFTADLKLADRDGAAFRPMDSSDALLANVNTPALEYAPALRADGLELLFTRWLAVPGSEPKIYRSTRPGVSDPFGPAELVSSLDGFVEAPALSLDGSELYFHRKDGDGPVIYRARRCA
jgi:hypothetical protein